jgi:hypothetical protein
MSGMAAGKYGMKKRKERNIDRKHYEEGEKKVPPKTPKVTRVTIVVMLVTLSPIALNPRRKMDETRAIHVVAN